MNETIAKLGRRLRLGVVGGGPGSFIGPVHRTAARMDDQFDVAAAVLSSDPGRSRQAGLHIGIAPDRAYGDPEEMLAAESKRDDGIDVLAVMTPNDSHFRLAAMGLERGLDVICDKPLTTTLEDAVDLVDRVHRAGRVFCTTYNYSGFPMVRQAQAMVRKGLLGPIRMAEVHYIQPYFACLSDMEKADEGAPWRLDPERAGLSMVLGDIGTHAYHLLCFVTDQTAEAISARVGAVVPGRTAHDCAMALLQMQGGAWGTFWVTNAAAGSEHGLHFRLFGDNGGLEWHEENPNYLRFMPIDGPVQTLARDGPGLEPEAGAASRVKFGHPEGYQEAFATLYREAAAAIVARRIDGAYDPGSWSFPTVEDGARGVKFIEAAVESSAAQGAWTDCRLSF